MHVEIIFKLFCLFPTWKFQESFFRSWRVPGEKGLQNSLMTSLIQPERFRVQAIVYLFYYQASQRIIALQNAAKIRPRIDRDCLLLPTLFLFSRLCDTVLQAKQSIESLDIHVIISRDSLTDVS